MFEMNEQELAEVSELAFQKGKKEGEEAGLKMVVSSAPFRTKELQQTSIINRRHPLDSAGLQF